MPIDPEIPLGITLAQRPAAQAPADPLATVGRFANIQNAINTNRLFQQTFAARQKAGQILAQAPDLETGMRSLYADPLVAPFAGEVVNSIRQGMLAQTQQYGELQKQALEGFGKFATVAPGLVANPAAYDKWANAFLGTVNPQVRDQVAQAIANVRSSLTDNLPSDPLAANAELRKRFAGIGASMGWSPDQFALGAGKSEMTDIGGQLVPTMRNLATGEVSQAGPGFAKTLAPTTVPTPGGAYIPIGGGYGFGTGSGVGGAGQNPLAVQGTGVDYSASAADGTPLFSKSESMRSPAVGTGIGGLQILSGPQKDMASKLADEFNTDERKQYGMAQQSLGSIAYMNNAYDQMVKGGGFLVPGAAADLRGALARFANTVTAVTGKQPAFDPEKVASIEEFNKETKRMALMVTNQFLGGQREAASVIQGITKSVPGIENTYLGGKLITSSLAATAQRIIDERNFKNAWQAQNQGNLTGATEAFNKLHPADQYANNVLKQFGMTAKGFESPDAVKAAFHSGFLTKDQAAQMLAKQFPDQYQIPAQGGSP